MKKQTSAINRFQSSRTTKTVAFLATGDEIVQGDVQDTNSHNFARAITHAGGIVVQRVQVSDNKLHISTTLNQLLEKSDAVIVTGGLGPTSDDVTRFAIADALKKRAHL